MENEAGTGKSQEYTSTEMRDTAGRLIIAVDTDGRVHWGRDITPAETAEALEHVACSIARRGFVSNLPKIEHAITHLSAADVQVDDTGYRCAPTVVVDGRHVFAFAAGEWVALPLVPVLGPPAATFEMWFNPPAAGAPDVE